MKKEQIKEKNKEKVEYIRCPKCNARNVKGSK